MEINDNVSSASFDLIMQHLKFLISEGIPFLMTSCLRENNF